MSQTLRVIHIGEVRLRLPLSEAGRRSSDGCRSLAADSLMKQNDEAASGAVKARHALVVGQFLAAVQAVRKRGRVGRRSRHRGARPGERQDRQAIGGFWRGRRPSGVHQDH